MYVCMSVCFIYVVFIFEPLHLIDKFRMHLEHALTIATYTFIYLKLRGPRFRVKLTGNQL